jgi:hypothetical protein
MIVALLFGVIVTVCGYLRHGPRHGVFNLPHLFARPHKGSADVNVGLIRPSSIVEYLSSKGSKQVALVQEREGAHLNVINENTKSFSVPTNRITAHIDGNFAFDDLQSLVSVIEDMKPHMVERLWERTQVSSSLTDKASDSEEMRSARAIDLKTVSREVYSSSCQLRVFACSRLMALHGGVFFEPLKPVSPPQPKPQQEDRASVLGDDATSSTSTSNINDDEESDEKARRSGRSSLIQGEMATMRYVPLGPQEIQDNLRHRAALKEFKHWYNKASHPRPKKWGGSGNSFPPQEPNLPNERVQLALREYVDGLVQLVARGHPWVANGWSRRAFDEGSITKGKQLLEFLELAPAVKNAKKVLEFLGVWTRHTNVEKYIMDIRDEFPEDVLEEANFLVDNAEVIPDADERIRRDLRYLNSYTIDSEGAMEIDDALSLEILEDGCEKLWVHIADVSRWIPPGSPLSLEAERRMLSLYMPDEKISMFPEQLSTTLLSLGASVDSYALSLGVTLNSTGEVMACELCPSKIRVTRRLSYNQLDKILQEYLEQTGNKSPAVRSSDMRTGVKGGGLTGASGVNGRGNQQDNEVAYELYRLNEWAEVRSNFREACGALDQYLRDKTDLQLSAKRLRGDHPGSKSRSPNSAELPARATSNNPNLYPGFDSNPGAKYSVTGYRSWANSTSTSLVSIFIYISICVCLYVYFDFSLEQHSLSRFLTFFFLTTMSCLPCQ